MARNRLSLGNQVALALSLFSADDVIVLGINNTKVGVWGIGLLARNPLSLCKHLTLALADRFFTDQKAGDGTGDGHVKDVGNRIGDCDAVNRTMW